MTRVTLSFSFNVENPDLFLREADQACRIQWNSSLAEVARDVPELVQAAFEIFVGSNGLPWPPGIGDNVDVEISGSVEDID